MSEIILDENQTEAVEYIGSKPLLIQAGPGAGKTRVLIERIKYLLKNTDADAESFLVITFTRKAANELKERLTDNKDISINEVNKMQISTIHSFCIKLLGECGKSAFTILDDDTDERRKMFIRRYRKELDLTEQAYFTGKQLNKVMEKFDEFTTFNVDIEKLEEYAMENHPVSREYIEFIDSFKDGDKFEFPYSEVMNDEQYKVDYYNAQYQAIVKAYPKYLEILEENNYMDFTLLQTKLLNLLDEDDTIAQNSRFKNILIDEFQDTDPTQMKIFEHFIDKSDSFTVVGDDDQSIYRFRGSYPKFFSEFEDNYDAKVITLSTNYRSGKTIVDFNEDFMDDYRIKDKDGNTNKQLNAYKENNKSSQVFSLTYAFNKTQIQAQKIVELIKYLKESNKINNYSDIGVLFRSVTTGNAKKLIAELERENIPYNLSESDPLTDKEEVKAMITLIWYLKENGDDFILSSWEKEWLGLGSFNNKFFNISDETKKCLLEYDNNYRCTFYEKALELLPEYIDQKDMKKVREYKDVFRQSDELIERIVEEIGKPYDLSTFGENQLLSKGIAEEDVDFFIGLNKLKERIKNKKDSILDVYYELLDYIGIIGDKFDNPTVENKQILLNIASLTRTIANYEEIVYKYDITGLYWFMTANLDNYSIVQVEDENDDYVQIMTIHKSKGLEFPVVIVGGIQNGNFPKETDVDKAVENYPTKSTKGYYTPIEFFDYKDFTIEDETNDDNLEEDRVLYVALTRAKRLLILSYAASKTGNSAPAINRMHDKNMDFEELTVENYDNIIDLSDEKSDVPEEDKIEISFSSFYDYNKCPHEYNLKYNYGFAYNTNKYLFYGTIAHSIMNQIHQRKISGYPVDDNIIDKIISHIAENNQNIDKKSDVFKQIQDGIKSYWNDMGKDWNIIASEYPFTSIKDTYNLTGQIDLIVKEGNDITIVDFKTTDTDLKKVSPDDHEKYLQQLSMYAIALKDDADFKNYNINKGIIYAIKNNDILPYDLDDKQLSKVESQIEDTVRDIKAEKYYKCNDDKCTGCTLFNRLNK